MLKLVRESHLEQSNSAALSFKYQYIVFTHFRVYFRFNEADLYSLEVTHRDH